MTKEKPKKLTVFSNGSKTYYIHFLQPVPNSIDWDKIKDKTFDELLNDSRPLCDDQMKRIEELTKDVIVNDEEDLG